MPVLGVRGVGNGPLFILGLARYAEGVEGGWGRRVGGVANSKLAHTDCIENSEAGAKSTCPYLRRLFRLGLLLVTIVSIV